MDVPVPPDVMTTLSADNVGASVQILSTYVRTCASRLQRTPGMLGDDTFTTAQSGNFSSSDATYFETLDELSFAEEGNYTVAAVAVLGNADNSTLLYYFQTFVDVIVKEVQVEAVEYDSDATYCRVTVQNPLEDALDSNELLVSSTSSEIEIAVQVARVVQAQQPVDIAWTATLTRNSSKDIQLPSPLEAAFVLDEDESGYYTIVSSVVKLCERSKACTEYSSVVDVSSADFSGNFTSASTAAFSSSGIVLPSPGWYSGFAQLTLAGDDADSHRYDFIKYFEVFATEENVAEQVESATYANDGSESYCWAVVAAADDEKRRCYQCRLRGERHQLSVHGEHDCLDDDVHGRCWRPCELDSCKADRIYWRGWSRGEHDNCLRRTHREIRESAADQHLGSSRPRRKLRRCRRPAPS